MSKSILCLCNKDVVNPYSGGGTILTHRLLRRFQKQGYKVIIISSKVKNQEDYIVKDGVEIFRIGNIADIYLKGPLFAKKIINKNNIDLIVDVGLLGIPFLSPLWFPKKKIVSLFFHFEQDVFIQELSHNFGIFGKFIGYFLKIFESKIIPKIYKNHRHLKITFSKPTYNEMISFGFPKDSTFWFQEGIILKNYNIEPLRVKDKYFVYVGRLKKYKGILDAVNAFKIFYEKNPNFKFYIIGDGPFRDELKRHIKELEMEDHIIMTGYISHKEKLELIRKSYALIMPSYKEGWATPVIEANALGTIAIVSDAPGVKETVVNGETGYIFKRGDIYEAAHMMQILVDSEKKRKEFEQKVLSEVNKFSWKETENRVVNLINLWFDL
ncbi:MAG: glycosyltransferase family 4 protein [Candidatus Helarchaeota archaeon]